MGRIALTGFPGSKSPMAMKKTGIVNDTLTQNRRVISISSRLSSSSSVTTTGSSDMPQSGQSPGLSRTISGCMGQVYCRAGAATKTRSSAIPHLGQSPAWSDSTSECIGQDQVALMTEPPGVPREAVVGILRSNRLPELPATAGATLACCNAGLSAHDCGRLIFSNASQDPGRWT
ncbi:hypothetical protein MnTg04_01753 [bacterium MnTg04]|nr:hypothetical protein MnTg04_01753 [bacterium MnTg04]